MSNTTHHEWVDSCADWAVSHPITRRAYIPQGYEAQGRYVATIEPKPPVDRVREEFDAEDQSDSADGVFYVYMLCIVAVIGAAVLAVLS